MYNAIIFRGLWGSIFSRGMDVLGEMLRKHKKIDYVLVLPFTGVERATNLINQFRDKTILIGHSFGAGAALDVAYNLPNKEFPLIVTYDPSQYWYRPHELTPNIQKCINFWQTPSLPFGIGKQLIAGAENIHVDTTHVRIDDRRDLHQIVYDAISKLP